MKSFFNSMGILGVFFAVSCSENSGKTPDQQFWDWFTPRSEHFAHIYSWDQRSKEEGGPDSTPSGIAMKEISAELEKVNPSFSAFLGGGKDDVKRNFIVTVYGDSTLFDEVDYFVNNAPQNHHWNFIALKPRTLASPGTVIRTGDFTIPLDDARFTFRKNKEGLADVRVYLHPEIDSDTPRAKGFARSLSIDMLGERLAGTALGEVDIGKLTDVPDDAHPFLEMGDVLERMLNKQPD